MRLPAKINARWMDGLDDATLVAAEVKLRTNFATLERRERKSVGDRYELMRGPADLMEAWDRWTRVSNEMRTRGLNRARPVPPS